MYVTRKPEGEHLDRQERDEIWIINSDGKVEFVVADIAVSSSNGVWVAGLPGTATIITVGQGFVSSGALVNAVPENDIETAVAIKADQESQ